MIKSVHNYPVSTLLDIEAGVIYAIPRYQREYTWGKWQWDALFDDLLENDLHYFLGSIICINQSTDALSVQQLELVDGQQRMTTLSILLAAIYFVFSAQPDLTMERQIELYNLKHKLVLKKKAEQPRLVPQVQNYNQQDYRVVLNMAGILAEVEAKPNAGKRRVVKAYRHFIGRIEHYLFEQSQLSMPLEPIVALNDLLEKVNSASLVKIEVGSHSDAYTLFESLNNRGVPLTAIDLIKNKLLAKLEQLDEGQIENHFNSWTQVIAALGDDYAVQERFFRHYYNAFRAELKDIFPVPVATKSNLIQIYEKIIGHDAQDFLVKMKHHSALYAQLIGHHRLSDAPHLEQLLQKLGRVQAAPSYLLLLLLFSRRDSMELTNAHLEQVVNLLIAFFVRRNTTDYPATRDLTRIFMELADSVRPLCAEQVYHKVANTLRSVSASDEQFKEALAGNLYEENTGVCRFILCALEEQHMTKEYAVDLWAMEGKQYVWTIEHIFPQGENIPDEWVAMIAQGDKALAEHYRQQYVHQLGNLTISGYNSTLGNKSFVEKRDRANRQGRPVGYRNGLFLNNSLAKAEVWTVANITKRTDQMVELILAAFPLPEGNEHNYKLAEPCL
ncbi:MULTISPECIES: DUF262 domain-containing protein [unclassified Serratia (in: enterobacteria)]|uniref:DUF262 domain-containing protein n=1 Tax=unclassified Serratia (in: enterobacteria) TaxID=2647522 RepID=UPI001CC07DD3|nr:MULTISPECIES: DUF262 domain-containing protein [unclassified Serratia (in: enterobacteria)]UAN51597.1 DUF262 domain-containing protein [Serratia sp. JSRIV002]UAN57600.1 DUF262 domain-containing protein [Serratia sp. JSRIV004]